MFFCKITDNHYFLSDMKPAPQRKISYYGKQNTNIHNFF